VVNETLEIGTGWVRKSESSINVYVRLSLAAASSDRTTACDHTAAQDDSDQFVLMRLARLHGRVEAARRRGLLRREM
jgi:uncharacterized protein (DUF736 family)